ncbi:MAG: hypothetical protein JNN07_11875 [Verrucomicrobiales bacterium]|nr:hypothetical protein [Verrucomicrobiales bacterium]
MKNTNLTAFTPSSTLPKIPALAAGILSLVLLTVTGCQTKSVSSQGGVVTLDEQFSIAVPANKTLKQGTETPMTIVLNRGADFKRDVQLDIKTDGLVVLPKSVLVKGSDKAEAQVQLVVSREVALGEYHITITGTPEVGKPATTALTVEVVGQ